MQIADLLYDETRAHIVPARRRHTLKLTVY